MKPALILLLAAASCATTPRPAAPAAAETVTLSRRWPYAICFHACSSYDLIVYPGGRVLRRMWRGEERRKLLRSRVSPAAAERFRHLLAPFRPDGERSIEPCPGEGSASLENRDVHQVEIRWSGTARPARLIACAADEALMAAIFAALQAIGLSTVGTPLDGS
jgi:hypothetical protein